MVHIDLVAVLFGLKLASHPFASIDAKLGAPQRFTVLLPANALIVSVLALHPVVGAIVCNLKYLIKQRISLKLSRAGVLFRECGLCRQPLADRRGGRHRVISANSPKALAICYALADRICHLLSEGGFPSH